MKDNIKSVVVLTAICLVVAALLAVTNFYTAPVIEANKAAAATGSLAEVIPGAAGFEEMELPADAPATVTAIYKETSGLGYVMTLETSSSYSASPMAITIGFGADSKISGVLLTNYQESKDFGADYPSTYVGQDSALGGVDTVAGVTYSSKAFKDAVTDAFNTLINSGLLAAGEKSEEQLIAEVMPLALPGCVNGTGVCVVEEATVSDASVTAAYKAKNGCGYIAVVSGANGTVVCGMNAFDDVQCFDLEGNDVTEASADAVAAVKASFVAPAVENLEADQTTAMRAFEDGVEVELTPVESTGSFGAVVAAFKATVGEEVQYVILTHPLGYNDEVMSMRHIINANGEIIRFNTLSELIVHGEYYSDHQLTDEAAYREQFIGLTEDTYSDDMTLVTGATITSHAVAVAHRSAFEVFNHIKEAA